MELENGQSVPPDEAHLQSTSAASTQAERTQRQLPWVVNGERGSRFFCPVNDCPHANLFQAKGWASLQGVMNHLKEHFAGRFSGAVPQAFLDAHKLCSCSICGKIISQQRFDGFCPSCRPLQRPATRNNPTEANGANDLPSLDEVSTTRVRLLKYVPRGARAVWGQALAQAAAGAVWHNSMHAWVEWAMLPKCVLLAPPRQGKSNKNDTVTFTKTRCERWLAGERMELWLDGPGVKKERRKTKSQKPGTSERADQRHQRCIELAADGQYSKATKALVSPAPLERDEQTEKVMREKHPLAERVPDLSDLAAPGRAQVPEFDSILVKKMLKSFS